MEKQTMYKLRLAIGILGIFLPVFLLALHDGQVMKSYSLYYYTGSVIAFTAIISSFSVVLISYTGYPKGVKEKWSDNLITTIAGIMAAIVVIVPAASGGPNPLYDYYDQPYLLGYEEGPVRDMIHIVCTVIFISLLGSMPFFKFVLSPNISRPIYRFYKVSGLVVWGAMLALGILFLVEKVGSVDVTSWFPDYIFWLETIAVWSFSMAWMVKGHPGKVMRVK